MPYKLLITANARQEIKDIWRWGNEHFGIDIANEYDALIQQALRDLKEDPRRLGSRLMEDRADGLYTYDLGFSNTKQFQIKRPSHAIFFYTIREETIAITSVSRKSRERHIKRLNRGMINDPNEVD